MSKKKIFLSVISAAVMTLSVFGTALASPDDEAAQATQAAVTESAAQTQPDSSAASYV